MTTGLTLTKAEAVDQLKKVVGVFFNNYKEDDSIDSELDNELCRDNERFLKQYRCETMGADPDEQRLGDFNEDHYKAFVDYLPMWEIGGKYNPFDCLLRKGCTIGGTMDSTKWSEWLNVSEPCTGKHAKRLPHLICHLTTKQNKTTKVGYLHYLMRWYLIAIFGAEATGANIPDDMKLLPIRTTVAVAASIGNVAVAASNGHESEAKTAHVPDVSNVQQAMFLPSTMMPVATTSETKVNTFQSYPCLPRKKPKLEDEADNVSH